MNEAEPEMVKAGQQIRTAFSLIKFKVEISTMPQWQKEKEMGKQVLKGLSMFMLLMTIAMVTAVVTANGQSGTVRAKVPFEFVVGAKTLPAGEYIVSSLTADTLKIASRDANDVAIRLSRTTDGKTDHAKMVFHRYGERYFLAEVWNSYNDGRELTTSKEERAMQKEGSRIASSKPAERNFEIVEVAVSLN